MKRFDLRHLHDNFYDRMAELIEQKLKTGEVGIFLFEVGDFTPVKKTHSLIKEMGHDLLNSLKFSEPDWTVVMKKLDEETRKKRADEIAAEKVKSELEAVAQAETTQEEKAK